MQTDERHESYHPLLESQQLTSAPAIQSWRERESQHGRLDKKRQRNCLGSREGDTILPRVAPLAVHSRGSFINAVSHNLPQMWEFSSVLWILSHV